MHPLEAFYRWDASAQIVLVIPESHRSYWNMLCEEIGSGVPHVVVGGGDTRFFSVKNGLAWIKEARAKAGENAGDRCLVAVHDGVRPFVPSTVIEACFDKAFVSGAAIPVVPMIDSIREKDGRGGSHPVDRSRYMAVQTPQVFDYELLSRAYEQPYMASFTDDASVVEALGQTIEVVPGERRNVKITTPLDLLVAEAILGGDGLI